MKYVFLFFLVLTGLSLNATNAQHLSAKLTNACSYSNATKDTVERYIIGLPCQYREIITHKSLSDGTPAMQAALKICINSSKWRIFTYLLSIFNNWYNVNLDILFDGNLTDEQCDTAVNLYTQYSYYKPTQCALF